MDSVPLESLQLTKKWPRLHELQAELAGLEKHRQRAEEQASLLHNQIPPAKERDLAEAAQALRSGGDLPEEGTHEQAAQHRLERAQKDAIIYRCAAEQVMSDIGALRSEHQVALFRDVLAARDKIAREMAEAAAVASSGYARFEDLSRLVKTLQPAEPVPEIGPARSVTHVINFATNQRAPERGDIEAALNHLIELGQVAPDEQVDGKQQGAA